MMSHHKHTGFVIEGVTNQGRAFRPSNWAERLQCCVTTFGPQRKQHFSPHVYINYDHGVKALVVEPALWETNPQGYEFLASFAEENNLKVVEESEAELARHHH